ncbi:MAG: peptide ABC transporter substrate-binding protein [Xanthomonadaceae bacterium]|nr:peptide ABC transporter substrate-binding protein [Xanthomonadaceae bacterium]
MKQVYLDLILCLLLLTGCTQKQAKFSGLKLHLSAEPATLNPSAFEDGHGLKVLANIVDPLFENDQSGTLKLLSAKDFSIIDNGKRIIIHIKDGLKWSDGSFVKSDDFQFGIERAIDPKRSGKQAHLFKALKSIETPDAKTIIFNLNEPSPYFLKTLSLPVSPLPKNWFMSQSSERGWSIDMPTNGPYYVSNYQKGQWIDLKENLHYGILTRKPKSKEIRWIIVQDEQTASQLFRSGGIDILTRVPSFEVKKFKAENTLNVSPFAATFYIGFNLNKAPSNNVNFRKLFAEAIDPEAVVSLIEGFDTPATSWLPPGFEGSNFQPKKTSQRLHSKDYPGVELSFDSSLKNQTISEFIQSQVLKKTKISITLSPADWKTHLSKLNAGATAVFRFAWQAPFSDPIPHLEVFTTNNPNNKTGWSSKSYDDLIAKIRKTPSGNARVTLIHSALKILLDDERVIIPVYHYKQLHAVSTKVKGFSVNPFSIIPIHNLEITKP